MRLQLRLLVIMMVALLATTTTIVLQHSFDLERSQHVLSSELTTRKRYFTDTLQSQEQPLKTLSEDYSFWDDMVSFVHSKDLTFAHENIDTGLSTFNASAAWVYDVQGKLIYASQADDSHPVSLPKLPSSFFTSVQKTKFSHFYVEDGSNTVDVRAATIVPSDDPNHQQPASGFWIVAQVLDSGYLSQLASLSESNVSLQPANSSTADLINGEVVGFGDVLKDWNQKPVAVIRSSSTVSIVGDLNHLYRQQLLLLLAVGISLLLLVSIVIWLWVLRPLRRISQSITSQKPELLNRLSKTNSEFGGLARTVQSFFAQKVAIQEAEIKRVDLERLSSEKTAFLAVAAHELKGPISIIQLLTQDLPKNSVKLDHQEFEKELDTVTHQTRKMALIINDLRLASQGQAANELEYTPVTFDFDQFLQAEITSNQFITRQQIEFRGGTNAQVNADPERLSQVVTNLIRNAAKYAPDSKIIQVRSRITGNDIVFEVQDFGIGISEEDQAKLFQRFYRAPSVTKTFQGLGLGLSICKQIVEHTGGRITVQSTLTKGSTFVVTLPIAHESAHI